MLQVNSVRFNVRRLRQIRTLQCVEPFANICWLFTFHQGAFLPLNWTGVSSIEIKITRRIFKSYLLIGLRLVLVNYGVQVGWWQRTKLPPILWLHIAMLLLRLNFSHCKSSLKSGPGCFFYTFLHATQKLHPRVRLISLIKAVSRISLGSFEHLKQVGFRLFQSHLGSSVLFEGHSELTWRVWLLAWLRSGIRQILLIFDHNYANSVLFF